MPVISACRLSMEEALKSRVWVLKSALLAIAAFLLACFPQRGATAPRPASNADSVVINLKAPTTPFPHFWEQMFGSGRAVLAMRANYLRDMSEVKRATGFDYVRFHGILNRGVGVYNLNAQGQPVYDFSYVDRIYDGLLARGVRPFVELSFMPPALAAPPVVHQTFWYHPVVSPPGSWARWDALMRHFARHLIARYGIDEVSKWYFEVWNEPNLDFWAGKPKQATYFELYDHTARALKQVSPLLRVGGPATAQSAWIPAFIDHVAKNHVPVDFVSTHIYGQDPSKNVFGVDEKIPITKMVCMAASKVHKEVANSPLPNLPIFYTEYNATFRNDPQITDSLFMGPWLADTIRQCDGLTAAMSYWTFSDVFEEQGVVKTPFYGGFGLIAADNLPKPAFNAFKLLHRLGTRRIPVDSKTALATRRPDGTVVAAAWNMVLPGKAGSPKQVDLKLEGIGPGWEAYVYRLDAKHGSLLAAYREMGSPRYPTHEQVKALRRAARLPAPELFPVTAGQLRLTLPPDGLAVVEFHAPAK